MNQKAQGRPGLENRVVVLHSGVEKRACRSKLPLELEFEGLAAQVQGHFLEGLIGLFFVNQPRVDQAALSGLRVV